MEDEEEVGKGEIRGARTFSVEVMIDKLHGPPRFRSFRVNSPSVRPIWEIGRHWMWVIGTGRVLRCSWQISKPKVIYTCFSIYPSDVWIYVSFQPFYIHASRGVCRWILRPCGGSIRASGRLSIRRGAQSKLMASVCSNFNSRY